MWQSLSGQFMIKRDRKAILKPIYILVIVCFFVTFGGAERPHAQAPLCQPADCVAAVPIIARNHATGGPAMLALISLKYAEVSAWLDVVAYQSIINPAMQQMTQALSASAMQQSLIIGQFFDAKEHMEALQDHQRLQAQAYKDYQPSHAFCAVGTSTRSLAATQAKMPHNRLALARQNLARQLRNESVDSAIDRGTDKRSRWASFTKTYCDVTSNWLADEKGLREVCTDAQGGERVNRDIDYTRFIGEARTIADLDFSDGTTSQEEQDIMALSKNLYAHNLHVLDPRNEKDFFEWRAAQAKRSIAQDSFQNIVALKAAGSSEAAAYLGALVAALGVPEDEVFDLIGDSPSYYAQLETLSKKIAQNPTFFANLYDKPANVERMAVALRAIELMIDREIYESRLRQEMQASALLSSRLKTQVEGVVK